MKKHILSLLAVTLLLSSAACKSKPEFESASEEEIQDAQEQIKVHPGTFEPTKELPQLTPVAVGDTIATIHTTMGDMKVRFFPEYAPKAVENFTTHAKNGYYNNVLFHRVINHFIVQGGDPTGSGTGGESIWGSGFEDEVSMDLRNFRGALCMANQGYGTMTNHSQFYISQSNDIGDGARNALKSKLEAPDEIAVDLNNSRFKDASGNFLTNKDIFTEAAVNEYSNNGGTPGLDMDYTVFGQIYEGLDVLDKIASVEVNNERPVNDIKITSIDVGVYGG